jgi:hypothetical protein
VATSNTDGVADPDLVELALEIIDAETAAWISTRQPDARRMVEDRRASASGRDRRSGDAPPAAGKESS